MATDPLSYGGAIPAWDGAWPPDPSWDEPYAPVPAVTFAPDPADVAAQAQAQAAADAMFAPPAPVVGQPRAVAQPFPGEPPETEPPDADLIEIEPEADWSGLTDPYADGQDPGGPPGPADGDLIEIEPNEEPAEPYAPTPAERTLRLAELAANDPAVYDRLARQNTLADLAAEDEAVTARANAAAGERKAAEDNERVYLTAVKRTREKSDAIAAEADRLANERVDPDGWRDSRSTFQTIAMYVAGMVGGLVQSRQGGPNQGLAMINNEIERHIAAQQANITNRRALLGDKRAALGDEEARNEADFSTAEAFRQNAWKRVADDIATERMQFDPMGTRALKLADQERAALAQQAAAREALIEKTLEREMKIGEYDLKVAAHNETLRKNQAAEGIAARRASGGGGASAGKLKYTPEQLAAQLPAGSWIPPAGSPPMTIADYGRLADAGRKGLGVNDPTDRSKREHELTVSGPSGPLVMADGTPYLAPDTTTRQLTAKKMAATREVINILQEVKAIRKRVGGESSWGNSDDYQRLKVLQSKAIILTKGGTEGMSSNEDMNKIAVAIGADNVESFRAQTAKLDEGIERAGSELNGWLESQNYDGAPITFPNPHGGKPKKTAEQAKLAKLVESTTGEKGQSIPTALAVFGPAVVGPARIVESLIRSESTDLGDGPEKDQIDAYANAAANPDPEVRKVGFAALLELADKSKSPAIRARATSWLDAAKKAGAPEMDEVE